MTLADELILSEAAEHARSGDHAAALRVLERVPGDTEEKLDLLARVQAQIGDLPAADRAWRTLLAANPEHPGALAGTAAIAEIQGGRRRSRPAPIPAIATAAVVTVLVAGSLLLLPNDSDEVSAGPSTTASPPSPPPSSSSARPTPSPQEAPQGDSQEAVRLEALTAALAAPNVTVERREHDVRVVFGAGLFLPNGSDLSAAGRAELTGWADRLRGQSVAVTVLGHGVSVAGGPASGGSTVAARRAVAAADVLAVHSGLPLTTFAARSADQSEAPHPGADPTANARNRTVTLLVTPAS